MISQKDRSVNIDKYCLLIQNNIIVITTELIDYIKAELQKGTSNAIITSNLTKNGWFNEDIQQAISQIQSPQTQESPVVNDSASSDNYYPNITIKRIENPNRFYAVPILGGLFKIIILIPVLIEIMVLNFGSGILTFINSFIVLFTGKYWQTAYDFNTGLQRLNAKMTFYLYGLTDTYPGFSFDIKDNYTVDINQPQTSSRFFAIPFLGGIVRLILVIPIYIFIYILAIGSSLSWIIASFPVLFKGYYPESLYEFDRDYIRLLLASNIYMLGLSDKYPSFSFSMNHKIIKILLIIYGIFSIVSNIASGAFSPKHPTTTQPMKNFYNYYSTPTPTMSFSNPQY